MEDAASVLAAQRGGPFSCLFESAAIGMALIDRTGLIRAANPALVAMLAYEGHELVDRPCEALTHPEDTATFGPLFEALIRGEGPPLDVAKRCLRRDGRTIWVRLTMSPPAPEFPFAVALVADITAPKRAERRHAIRLAVTQQLAEAPSTDAALSAIFAAMCRSLEWDYGELWLLDPEGTRLEQQLSWFGGRPELQGFADASRDYVFKAGEGLPGRVWAERRPVWIIDVRLEPSFQRQELVEAHDLRGAIGFPIVSGTEFLGVMAFFSRHLEEPDPDLLAMMADIGSQIDQYLMRRRAEERLLLLGSVLAATDDVILTLDGDGTIASWNQAAEVVYGYSASELKGQTVRLLIPPDRLQESVALFERVQRGDRIEHLETVRVRKDGTRIDVSLTVVPVCDADGRVCCTTAVIRDITARKQAERYKDEFLSVLSHELKTPLNFIMGFGSILADDEELHDYQQTCVTHILEGADRLYLMIQNLLCLTDILAGRFKADPEYTPLDVLMNEALQSLRNQAEQKNLLLETFAPLSHDVFVDGKKIIQLLAILLENAIKFTPTGGSVRVEALVSDGELSLRVHDTGIGIDPCDQPRLFTRLQQLDMSSTRKAGGLGVGLSIGKAIAEAHAGTIGVESRPGKGCTFWVRLPQPPAPPTS